MIYLLTGPALLEGHMAMGPNPVPPANIPMPTKIGSKMVGEFTHQPKWDPIGVDPQPNVKGVCGWVLEVWR